MRFRGEFGFLSNFFPCTVAYEGRNYPCVEAAYQAAKTLNPAQRCPFERMDGAQAKREGRKVKLRPDWNACRTRVMAELLASKFSNPTLKNLLSHVNGKIEEENTWHDTFWGVCTCPACHGRGDNTLGLILTFIRDYQRR